MKFIINNYNSTKTNLSNFHTLDKFISINLNQYHNHLLDINVLLQYSQIK